MYPASDSTPRLLTAPIPSSSHPRQTPSPRPFPRVLVLSVQSGHLISLSIPSSSLPRLRPQLPKHLQIWAQSLPEFSATSMDPDSVALSWASDSTRGCLGSSPRPWPRPQDTSSTPGLPKPLSSTLAPPQDAQAPPQNPGPAPRLSKSLTQKAPVLSYLNLQLALVQGGVDQGEHGGVRAGWGRASARGTAAARRRASLWGRGPGAGEPPQAALRRFGFGRVLGAA